MFQESQIETKFEILKYKLEKMIKPGGKTGNAYYYMNSIRGILELLFEKNNNVLSEKTQLKDIFPSENFTSKMTDARSKDEIITKNIREDVRNKIDVSLDLISEILDLTEVPFNKYNSVITLYTANFDEKLDENVERDMENGISSDMNNKAINSTLEKIKDIVMDVTKTLSEHDIGGKEYYEKSQERSSDIIDNLSREIKKILGSYEHYLMSPYYVEKVFRNKFFLDLDFKEDHDIIKYRLSKENYKLYANIYARFHEKFKDNSDLNPKLLDKKYVYRVLRLFNEMALEKLEKYPSLAVFKNAEMISFNFVATDTNKVEIKANCKGVDNSSPEFCINIEFPEDSSDFDKQLFETYINNLNLIFNQYERSTYLPSILLAISCMCIDKTIEFVSDKNSNVGNIMRSINMFIHNVAAAQVSHIAFTDVDKDISVLRLIVSTIGLFSILNLKPLLKIFQNSDTTLSDPNNNTKEISGKEIKQLITSGNDLKSDEKQVIMNMIEISKKIDEIEENTPLTIDKSKHDDELEIVVENNTPKRQHVENVEEQLQISAKIKDELQQVVDNQIVDIINNFEEIKKNSPLKSQRNSLNKILERETGISSTSEISQEIKKNSPLKSQRKSTIEITREEIKKSSPPKSQRNSLNKILEEEILREEIKKNSPPKSQRNSTIEITREMDNISSQKSGGKSVSEILQKISQEIEKNSPPKSQRNSLNKILEEEITGSLTSKISQEIKNNSPPKSQRNSSIEITREEIKRNSPPKSQRKSLNEILEEEILREEIKKNSPLKSQRNSTIEITREMDNSSSQKSGGKSVSEILQKISQEIEKSPTPKLEWNPGKKSGKSSPKKKTSKRKSIKKSKKKSIKRSRKTSKRKSIKKSKKKTSPKKKTSKRKSIKKSKKKSSPKKKTSKRKSIKKSKKKSVKSSRKT
jgi:hypothetical protein